MDWQQVFTCQYINVNHQIYTLYTEVTNKNNNNNNISEGCLIFHLEVTQPMYYGVACYVHKSGHEVSNSYVNIYQLYIFYYTAGNEVAKQALQEIVILPALRPEVGPVFVCVCACVFVSRVVSSCSSETIQYF